MGRIILLTSMAALCAATDMNKSSGHEDAPHQAARLTEAQRNRIDMAAWNTRTQGRRSIWISIAEQMCRIIERDQILWEAPCATATNGPGNKMNSYKTPLGWHSIVQKVGDDAPWGQVFRARRPTNEIWKPGDPTSEDLVLTRILALTGEEPGHNKGGDVDSRARHIYLHGTNDEQRIGTPSSHGCIRLTNDAVISAYERIPIGTPVLITEE